MLILHGNNNNCLLIILSKKYPIAEKSDRMRTKTDTLLLQMLRPKELYFHPTYIIHGNRFLLLMVIEHIVKEQTPNQYTLK